MKNILCFQGDVGKMADLDLFYQEIFQHFGKIDVLVANAGIGGRRRIDNVDEKFFDEIINTNLKGIYFTVQKAIPFLNQNASIILISSAAAHLGWPNHGVYATTKAAVSYLARTLSADLLSQGIRVNAISPGYVDTPRLQAFSPERQQEFLAAIPVKRFAHPDEIAHAVLFLASSLSSYIVAADLIIDGGLTAIKKE